MVKLACRVIKSSFEPSSYVVMNDNQGGRDTQTFRKHPIIKSNLINFSHFLLRRLTMDKKGPNLPAVYEATMLESDLFKETFDFVIDLPLSGKGVDRNSNSKIKKSFIQMISILCYNEPTQIPKLIDRGLLLRLIDMIKLNFPVTEMTIPTLIEFVRMISIHDKGKELIINNKIFEMVLAPCVQEGPNKELNESMVI